MDEVRINMVENDSQEECEITNKSNSSYLKNPFYKSLKVNNGLAHRALIDTGADISIIHRNNLPKKTVTMTIPMNIKTASGETMHLKEQAIDLEGTHGETKFTFSPMITTSNPKYTILGADTIISNPSIL